MSHQEATLNDHLPHLTAKKSGASSAWLISVSVLLGMAAWLFITKVDYKPGSDLGYNLGLIGGVAMLLTLLYTAAKRVRFMYSWIQMKHWFYAHMVLGIVGPIFILLHSKFTLESVNGTLAFSFTCLVCLSGFAGRYLASRVRHGLDGKRAVLQELKQKIGISAEDVRSKFHFAPRVTDQLQRFEASILLPSKSLWLNLGHFLILPFHFQWTYLSACRHFRRGLKKRAQSRGWDWRKTRKRRAYGRKIIWAYVGAIRSVARSDAYEQLFSLWYLVHFPLLFWLAITGAIHVLAVHMY